MYKAYEKGDILGIGGPLKVYYKLLVLLRGLGSPQEISSTVAKPFIVVK